MVNPTRCTTRWFATALVLLVVLGCGLRFHHLGKKSLWADELFTLNIALHHPLVPAAGQPWYRPASVFDTREGDSFLTVKAGEQSPPLFDLLQKASVQALGPTEFAARLPAALAASALLACFAWIAWRRRDPWEQRVLAWATLLIALHPALIIYAKDGRAYSLGASLIGMGGLLWMLRWRHGWRGWQPPGWAEIVLLLAACYTHYNAAVMVALLLVADAVMATRKRSRVAWVRLLVLGGVFMLWVAVNMRTIAHTASGAVSWGSRSAAEFAVLAVRDVSNAVHAPWMALMGLILVGVLVWRRRRGQALWSGAGAAGVVLVLLVVVQVGLAATITAKAGMAHPRYYLFAVPLALVAIAMVLANLRGRWQLVGALSVAGLAAVPGVAGMPLGAHEQFREMTADAVQGTDADTLFLYPAASNLSLYRIYLDRFLRQDSRSRMVVVDQPSDAPQVCERLGSARHVVAFGHASGMERIQAVHAQCGARWPQRVHRDFKQTFTEHWRGAER